MNIIVEFEWDFATIPTSASHQDGEMVAEFSLGNIIPVNIGGLVDSVNGHIGDVELVPADIGAEVAGAAQAVKTELQPQIEANAQGLNSKADALATTQALAGKANAATVNQQLAAKATQIDLDAAVLQLQSVVQGLTNTATKQQYDFLVAQLGTKANQDDVAQQIASLLNADAQTVAAIETIRDALNEDQGLLEALDYTVANRVRFDTPGQGLTALQKYNARNNIGAEEAGTASLLIAQITTATLGAATAQQGAKADTAVQPGQLAAVATSNAFADLSGKAGIFSVLFAAYEVGANLAFAATDSLGTMLGKAQGQFNALWTALGNKQDKLPTNGTAGQFLANDLTWKTPSSSGGGGIEPVWTDLVLISGNGWATGYADGTNKMQVGKDANGYIWLRGAMRNTLTTANSNFPFSFPTTHQLKIGSQENLSFPLPHVHWTALLNDAGSGTIGVGNIYGTQLVVVAGSSVKANTLIYFPPVIVAPAK